MGCKRQTTQTVITFWAMGAEAEHVQKLIPDFEKQNPDIKVRVQSIPWTAAHEKLLTAFVGNSTPDISQLGNTWIPEFYILNAIENFDERILSSKFIKKEKYFPGIWETNIMDTSVYGIPWYVDTRLLFYRKDILAEAGYTTPPQTWDELYDCSMKIKNLSTGKDRYAILLPTNEWVPFVLFGMQAGSTLLRDDYCYGDFTNEKFEDAFKYLMKFYEKKLAPSGISQVSNVYQAISEGYIAMYITGPWNIGEFTRRLPKEMQDKWMTAPMPGSDKFKPGVSVAGGSSFVIFRQSKNKDAAWKLIEFLSQKEQQITFYKYTGDLPAIKDAWLDTSLTNNIFLKAFYTQLENVAPTPKIPEWEQIAMKVQQYAEIAAISSRSIPEVLTALDKDVDRILEKRRWMTQKNK